MRIIFLLCLIIVTHVLTAQNIKSLSECITIGIENNLSTQNKHLDILESEAALSQNRAKLLPIITGQFHYTDFIVNPVNVTTGTILGNDFPSDPTWQTIRSTQHQVTTGIQIAMPLFNHSILSGIDVAKTIREIKKISYDKAVEDLILQISKVYYSAQVWKEQITLTDNNIARMEELRIITEALYQAGIIMEVDLQRVIINKKNLDALKINYNTLYMQQINLLKFLLDFPENQELSVETMPREIELIKTEGVSESLPELKLAKGRLALTEKQIKAVKSGYIPTLSFIGYAGGIGYQDKFNHFFRTENATRNWFGNVYLGISLNIPIFDAKQRRGKITQYKYELQQADNMISLCQKELQKSYLNASLQLSNCLEQFRMYTENHTHAKAVYENTAEKYQEGIASTTELLQDEMRLQNAQSACIQSHYMCNLAQLDLLKLSSNLKELL